MTVDTPSIDNPCLGVPRAGGPIAPLIPTTTSHEVPSSYPALVELLSSRPQPAVVWHGADGERVELSGRVLQNWTVKLIGLLAEEADLDAVSGEATVIVDAAPHWKAAAVVLACGALGCRVLLGPGPEAPESVSDDAAVVPDLVITDRPGAWERSERLGEAELAALSPGLLDASWAEAVGEQLPAWVLDVSAEVRQHPDQLIAPLPEQPLPPLEPTEPTASGPASGALPDPLDGLVMLAAEQAQAPEATEQADSWDRWLLRPWTTATLPLMLHVWGRGRPVVLVDAPASGPVWRRALGDESIG